MRTQLSAYSTRELVGVLDGLIAEHPELEQVGLDRVPVFLLTTDTIELCELSTALHVY